MVGGGKGRGKPVSWPPDDFGGVEEVTIPLNGGCSGGVLWLGVRQWMSSVLGTEKDTPMSRPLAAMVVKSLCRLRMLPL